MSFSSRAFVIPLQSARKFVYALILPVRYIWTADFLRLSFAFLRNSHLMSPRQPRARHAHRAYMLNCKQQKQWEPWLGGNA